ncbi:Uncharacterised protein [Achromobacter xylosoxidans]|nr:Uncharacterised protein [Achromobacter xylosoxidans]
MPQDAQRHGRHAHGQPAGEQARQQHGPGQARRLGGGHVQHVGQATASHQQVGQQRDAPVRPAAGLARRQQRAGHGAHHQRHEQVGEIGFRQPQHIGDEVGRGPDQESLRGEQQAERQAQRGVVPVAQHARVVAAQCAPGQRLASIGRQRFGQAPRAQQPGRGGQRGQQQEYGPPALVRGQVAAQDRRQRRRQIEHQDQVGHGAARHGAVVAIADDGLADHDAGARRQALHRASGQQPAEAGRQRRHQRAAHVHPQRSQHHATPPQRVGQRAMQQQHGGIAGHVDAQRQLHGFLRHGEFPAQRAEGGQVGVDGGGGDTGQQAQHQHHHGKGRQGFAA